MGVIRVDENDPVGELEPSFPFRDVKILHDVDVRDFYHLQEEIGRGKFGTVYRCVEKKTGIVLAAKFVPIAKKQDRINVEREVEIMRTLQHPRLIQIYDAFEIHNVMCVVLELIEGGELFERVIDDDFILTEKACAVFMRQICEGVSFIHQNKIIHLDLKPENILCLTKTGNRIKIIDFGLARKYDPNKKLQVLFGTPEFVAPEVVNFDEITSATDMWSVGVICYVLLSGLSPFMGENDLQTMTNVTLAQYDFDDEAFDSISADAKDFIKKLLVKSKEKRLTAGECANHPWLKRKPPPPTYLEQSKENLKTYVDSMHSSSPFLLCETLSNGTANSEVFIPSSPEISKHKTPPRILDKPLPVFVTPELPPLSDNQNKSLDNDQNLKIKNEINLEKSASNKVIVDNEPQTVHNLISTLLPTNSSTNVKIDERDPLSKKAVKTDSFKELPRKFSITVSDGSRELPRRSSLTRADKAKEIKRETFVTFVGPREIKPIDDPISLDVRAAVEELSTFIKSNIEESSLSKISSVNDSSTSSISNSTCSNTKVEMTSLNSANVSETRFDSNFCINKFETKSRTENITDSSFIDTRDKTHLKDQVTSLLRPAEYLKLTTSKHKDSSFMSGSAENSKLSSFSSATFSAKPSFEIDTKILSSKDKGLSKSTSFSQSISSIKPLKTVDSSDTVLGPNFSSSNRPGIFKLPQSSNKSSATEKKDNSSTLINQPLVSSISKEKSYSSKSHILSSKDSTQVAGTSSRSQNVFEPTKKQTSFGDLSETVNKAKLNDSTNVYSYFSSSTIRGDSTIPRKSQINRLAENVNTAKDNSSVSSTVENKRTRASSLDPTPIGYSLLPNQEQPFQSRFLRSTPLKLEPTYRCTSEVATSKYEEFKSRYSNYKDLVNDNEKYVRKSFISERITPKTNEKVEDSLKTQGNVTANLSQSSSSKQAAPSSLLSSNLPSYSIRQKFNLDDQKRDIANKFDFRTSKIESSLSNYRTDKDRYTRSISVVKESSSQKFSQTSTVKNESKSKLSIPEKCPNSPQKSL